MKISMIGQRGIPATYGGVERHVEELSTRLADKGNDVTVYCRENYVGTKTPRTFCKVKRVVTWTVVSKHLEAAVHSLVSTFAAIKSKPDIIHYHAIGPGLAAPIAKLFSRAKVVQTIHGRNDLGGKWGLAAGLFMRFLYLLSRNIPDLVIVISRDLETDYKTSSRKIAYITNGVSVPKDLSPPKKNGSKKIVLSVGRLVPEKSPDALIRACQKIDDPELELHIVGDSSFTDDYVKKLIQLGQSSKVVFDGYKYGQELEQLFANASVFVTTSRLEGLPLTLLEAIARGLPVVASDIGPHKEILSHLDGGYELFGTGDEEELTTKIKMVVSSEDEYRTAVMNSRQKVLEAYDWDRVTQHTLDSYRSLLQNGSKTRSTIATGKEQNMEMN